MVRNSLRSFSLQQLHSIVQEEINQDSIDAREIWLVDTLLPLVLLRRALLLVFEGFSGGCWVAVQLLLLLLRRRLPFLTLHFWVPFFDLALDEFYAPDADAADFDLPVGVALDGSEGSDVAL